MNREIAGTRRGLGLLARVQLPQIVLLMIILCLAACGGGGTTSVTAPTEPPAVSMGGGALGGNAETTLLAREALGRAPSGDLAWIAHEIRLEEGQRLEHTHEFAFVYALERAHQLKVESEDREVAPRAGAAVPEGTGHSHEAAGGHSLFWEVRLASPGSGPPPEAPNARLVFESPPMEGLPGSPLATFVHVLVPPGGETSVHTHPGPEFIYQVAGEIEYQNGLIGSIPMVSGDAEGIPPQVPVQKRNLYDQDAEFLSWFLVSPLEPFASPARFLPSFDRGENLASAGRGGRVSAVSSNFGGAGTDSSFGANNVLDGDPPTQWSSDGDGDGAWIEVELPEETRVRSVGFWTRTMGASAQVLSFSVATDGGEVRGPFQLGDAAAVYYFETDFVAKRLRFEAVETSGGNTGAVEIEVYGDPVR